MHFSSNNMAAAAVVAVISTRTRYTHYIAILYTPEQRVHTAYNDKVPNRKHTTTTTTKTGIRILLL